MGPSPLRRSNRGEILVEIPDLPNIKSTKENTANNSKQSSDDDEENKKPEKQDPDVGGSKRKRFNAFRYKTLFKPQRIRIQLEAQSHDEPACEGAIDIESIGSHTSVKEVVDATVLVEHIGEVPAQHLDDDMEVDGPHVDSGYMENATLIVDDVAPAVECVEVGTPARIHAVEAHNESDVNNTSHFVKDRHETVDVALEVECAETGTPGGIYDQENAEDGEITPDVGDGHHETNPNDMLPHVQSAEMGTPAGTCNNENTEDGEIIPDTSNAGDSHNDISPKDVLPRVESAEMATSAGTCVKDNAEDGEIIPDTPNVDHDETSPKDVPLDFAEMLMAAGSELIVEYSIIRPDGLEPTIPEIQNEPRQPKQLSDHGVHNLQPSDASQLDQIIPDVENPSDQMVAENPSDTLPSNGTLLEPICQEPNLIAPQSGEHFEENLVAAAETPLEEHQLTSAASVVVPTLPVNPLNMFDNLTNRVSAQMLNDPLQSEVERLYTEIDNEAKSQQETKQKLNSECEKEIAEVVAHIKLKYEAKHVEADAAYNTKKTELVNNINKVIRNRVLAEAFRSKCQDHTYGHTGIQQVSQVGLMQQMYRLSVSSSMRPHYHGAPSSSPCQSSGIQQPPQPPQQPVQQRQTRPPQPLQVVYQPAALFSSIPPPPMVNQTTSSSPSTTSRPPPVITQITPTTTPTPSSAHITSRPQPGYNTINPSTVPNRSFPSIAQIDMYARGQSPYMRPQISSEPRGPAPHMRRVVSNDLRAPAPHMRPVVSNVLRAPAPHLRPLTPRNRPPCLFPDIGTHQRMLPGQRITTGPSQSPVTPTPSTSLPQSLTPLSSEPCTMPPSERTPLFPSFNNLFGVVDNAPRGVNFVTPQQDTRSQTDRRNIIDLVQESTAQSTSAREVVCLSDDD